MEQVQLYANPSISSDNMRILREGLQRGMTAEQIQCVIDADLDYAESEELCFCFANHLPQEQIDFLAHSELGWKQMAALKEAFLQGLSVDDIQPHIYEGIDVYTLSNLCDTLIEEMDLDMGGM